MSKKRKEQPKVPVELPDNAFNVHSITTGYDTSGNAHRYITYTYHPLISDDEAYILGIHLLHRYLRWGGYNPEQFKQLRALLKHIEKELTSELEEDEF